MQNQSIGFLKAYGLYWKHYFDFEGHSSRSEFWWVFLWNIIINAVIIAAFIGFVYFTNSSFLITSFLFLIVFSIWFLINIIPNIALTVRRYHDVGISGFWFLLTPFLGELLSELFKNFRKIHHLSNGMHYFSTDKFALTMDICGIILSLVSFVIVLCKTKTDNNKYIK